MKSIKNALKRCSVSIKTGCQKYDISVVVPIYNTAKYLPECIDSILAQTKDKIQVILVDDGSTDNSEEVGRRYAQTYKNVAYVKKENSGVGATRNTGARLASGKYIAFVDSDDKIDPCMFERLFNLAEENHCEVATCGMLHFSDLNGMHYPSPLFDNAFKHRAISVTTLEDAPEQLYSTSSCNKLILRSTFEGKNLSFPEGMVYEDFLSSARILDSATKIAITPEKLYFYRTRAQEGESITQQTHKLDNLLDRIAASRATLKYLEDSTSQKLLKQFQLRTIDHDLKLLFRSLPTIAPENQPKAVSAIASYVNDCISSDVLNLCSDLARIKIKLAQHANLKLLLRVIEYEGSEHKKAPIHQKEDRLFTHAPSFLHEHLKEAGLDKIIDVTRDVLWKEPTVSIEHIEADGGTFSVWGCIYQNHVSLPLGSQEYQAFLTDEFGHEIASLPIKEVAPRRILKSHTVMRNLKDQEAYDYSGCGFKIDLPDSLCSLLRSNNSLLVRVDVKNPFFESSQYLRNPAPVVKALEDTFAQASNEGTVSVEFSESGWLRVTKKTTPLSSAKDRNKTKTFVSPDAPRDIVNAPERQNSNKGNLRHGKEVRVSVVVPIHENDRDLDAALKSLEEQTLQPLQVIMIDDGTTWDGAHLAQTYAERYPHFELHHKESGTLGEACNFGSHLAKGEYLAFASANDTMAPTAYENLADLAQARSAQIASGDFDHIYDRGQTKACNLAQLSFDKPQKEGSPNYAQLTYDTLPWNHLFDRGFYEQACLQWPTDATFDDSRLMTRAYAFAKSTCYLHEIVWHWRRKNRDDLSIARKASQVEALAEKIKLLSAADNEFRQLFSNSEAQIAHDFRRLDIDLRSDLLQIPAASEADREEASRLIRDYLDTLSKASFAKLRAVERMKYRFACERDFSSFVEFRKYELKDYKLLVIKQEDERFLGRFPSNFALGEDAVMNEELRRAISTNVSKVSTDSGFVLSGQIYPYRVPVHKLEDLNLTVMISEIDGTRKLELECSLEKSKKETRKLSSKNGGTLSLDQPYRNYAVTIPTQLLNQLPQGEYRLLAEYEFRGLACEPFYLGKPVKSKKIQDSSLNLENGRLAHLGFDFRSNVVISID